MRSLLVRYKKKIKKRHTRNGDVSAGRIIHRMSGRTSRKKSAILMFKLCFRPFDMDAMRWQQRMNNDTTIIIPTSIHCYTLSRYIHLRLFCRILVVSCGLIRSIQTLTHTQTGREWACTEKNEIVLESLFYAWLNPKFMDELRMSVYLLTRQQYL